MRPTPGRIDALRHAAGEYEQFPTYGVAVALEKAGLMTWRGWRPGRPASERITDKPYPAARGWFITKRGEEQLAAWVAAKP